MGPGKIQEREVDMIAAGLHRVAAQPQKIGTAVCSKPSSKGKTS